MWNWNWPSGIGVDKIELTPNACSGLQYNGAYCIVIILWAEMYIKCLCLFHVILTFCTIFSFQYVLGAATSPATKLYEETLTYLNQGWYALMCCKYCVNSLQHNCCSVDWASNELDLKVGLKIFGNLHEAINIQHFVWYLSNLYGCHSYQILEYLAHCVGCLCDASCTEKTFSFEMCTTKLVVWNNEVVWGICGECYMLMKMW